MEIDIPVRFYLPEEMENGDFTCRLEVDWPRGTKTAVARHVDAVASLYAAFQMAGALVYSSEYHQNGDLVWLERNRGYGLPLPKNSRDLYVGDDVGL